MNIIGNFTGSDSEGYSGFVYTLAFTGQITLEPVKQKASEESPDFRISTAKPRQQARIQLGAAWKESSEAGKPYLNLRIDDPSFPAPIVARLIQLDGQEGHSLIWSRS